MRAAKPLVDVLEKEWDAQLVGTRGKPGLARQLCWDGYHTLRSKGSAAGYPDWTLWRERVIWIETKREKGVLSDGQKVCIRGLLDAGAEVYVVRPRDLDDIAKVLAARGTGARWSTEAMLAASRLSESLNLELGGETV